MKNIILSTVFVFSKVGNVIDSVERKALTPKGLGMIINAIILLTMFVSCTEKMTNPYSQPDSSAAVSTPGLPPLDSFQVNAIGSSQVNSTAAVEVAPEKTIDTISSHTQLIVEERTTPKLDSLEQAESAKSAITKKAPSTIATSTKINKAPKVTKAKTGSGLIGIKHKYDCMCEVKEQVTNPKQTVVYFAHKANISVQEFIDINKPQVFLNRQKATLKKGVAVCLKRQDCLK